MTSDIVFMDIETLGIPLGAPIWEFAAIRCTADGSITDREHLFVRHDTDPDALRPWLSELPPDFVDDYRRRYAHGHAIARSIVAARIAHITRHPCKIAGSNPTFDMQHLELLLASQGWKPGWHYHPLDIPSMAMGYLAARGRLGESDDWRSNPLSRALGVEPDTYNRHTAEGDTQWTYDQWRAITTATA